MKILTNEQYKLFLAQQGKIEQLQKENEKLMKENKILSRDLRDLQNFCINFAADQKAKSQHNSPSDLIYPNTDERGLGEPDTPIDISDIFSL